MGFEDGLGLEFWRFVQFCFSAFRLGFGLWFSGSYILGFWVLGARDLGLGIMGEGWMFLVFGSWDLLSWDWAFGSWSRVSGSWYLGIWEAGVQN